MTFPKSHTAMLGGKSSTSLEAAKPLVLKGRARHLYIIVYAVIVLNQLLADAQICPMRNKK